MKAQSGKYVSIDYTLSLDSGDVVERSRAGESLGFVFGSGQVIPGLKKKIEGMEPGQDARVTVKAEEAYGEPQPELFREIPRKNFPDDLEIEPGMGFEARGPRGPISFRVRAVCEETVAADFNHLLAGRAPELRGPDRGSSGTDF
jgi:FKBP-type peptidyl-prolyl cis-trans isomerase SlyD